jgi:hypothetical protein
MNLHVEGSAELRCHVAPASQNRYRSDEAGSSSVTATEAKDKKRRRWLRKVMQCTSPLSV